MNGRYVPRIGAERCPASQVTWCGAEAYCAWLSRELGHNFRLPTEAEWECAARGAELRLWPWGNEESISLRTCASAQASPTPFYDFRGLRWSYTPWDEQRPWVKAPVGSFPLGATPDGVYDMLGYYAGQWCSDSYHGCFDRAENNGDARQEASSMRVVRGMYHVPVNYSSWQRSGLELLRVLIPGDAKWPQYTSGRTWSRMGQHLSESWALFRVASDP